MPLFPSVRVLNVVLFAAAAFRQQIIPKDATPGPLRKFGAESRTATLIIDGGSSGSKVFAFHPEKLAAKFLTRCTDPHVQAGHTLQGVSALAYNKSECDWQVGAAGGEALAALGCEFEYSASLLKLLADTYKSGSGASNLDEVRNRDEVPMLATAGMRLISQADNRKVWGYVCGRTGSGLTLAPAGEKCGTIPGTTEAYYEFLANAARGRGNRTLTGTFTIGGASAQIAIPLKTEADVAAFEKLRGDIAQELDCTKLTLSDGNAAPIFNTHREGGPRTECVDDYITFRPSSMIKATGMVLHEHIRIAEIRGLGLISFLGLQGRGSFVAGGNNELEHWAKQVHCDTGEHDFATCVQKLRTALANDIMWKHVTRYFKDNALNIDSFSYNTHSARPQSAGFSKDKVDGQNAAWELEKELEHKCGSDAAARFGYKKSNTCMRAMFTSMYVTAFFARENGSDGHSMSELHFDPVRDWAEGKLEEAQSFLQRRDLESEGIWSLLRVPVAWHDVDYIDGANIHHSAVDANVAGTS